VRWTLAAFLTRAYAPAERTLLQTNLERGGPRDLALLHTRLGEWFAATAAELLASAGVAAGGVAAIGSHGQTIWHEPPRAGERGSSLQLGCPATIAERTGIGVVSDFRSRDLAAGGHGAPLVPWADRVLFSAPDRARALQNLGGMGNVTWLPPAGSPAPLVGFDTGPGVALLDAAAEIATGGAWSFDRDGALARRGRVAEGALATLLAHPFFQQAPPRSTGRELFGPALVRAAARALEAETGARLIPGEPEEGWPDLLATLTALTAQSIGDSYRRWVVPLGVDEAFLLGGGARNPALAEAIARELAPIPVRPGEALGMDPDAREAAAFALLAWAHLMEIPANVPEATGSAGPRVLGSWTPPGRGRGESP
jgi:anhydro-N-acetylmuramic acid kinase